MAKKTKATPQAELLTNKSEIMRQLADQLTTVFLVALLCLWLAVTRPEESVHVQITPWPWWYFVILSVVALPIWLLAGRKRDISPKRRWTALGVALVIIWFTYLIKRIYIGSEVFFGFADFLLILAALLLIVLALIKTGWGMKGKLGNAIKRAIKQREFYDPLSILVVFASIFLGWKMLSDAGVKDWWMTPLLLGGILVFVVVELVYVCTSQSGRDHH